MIKMSIENITEFEARRIKAIEVADQRVIRGISDDESTEIIQRFPDYAKKFSKLREGIGSGFAHAVKHASEFDSEEAFKRAVTYALSSSLVLNSRGTRLYLAGLNEQTQKFMLSLTITDPVLCSEVMHTSYSAIAQPGPKDITKTFEGMVRSKDVMMFAGPEGEQNSRVIELFTNDQLAVLIRYQLRESNCFVDSNRITRSEWERTKSGLIVPSRGSCERFISGIKEEDKVIDLRNLYSLIEYKAA
jgi:hypothetical protein